MNYKKLVSVFAISAFALGACDAGEEQETEEPKEETSSSKDQIKQAKESSGEAFPEYGLEVTNAVWTVDGYEVSYPIGGEATATATIKSEQTEYNVYLLEDNEIIDIAMNEPEVSFTVDTPAEDSEYLIGITEEDLGEIGDEAATEDFYRFEKIIFVETEATEEEE